jgi:hypothetical protein
MNHTHVPFWFSEQFVYKNPIQFENLTRHKITFISQKVYQKDARHNRNGMADSKPVLTEFVDFSKQPDSDFDRLEPLEERKLINRAFRVSDNPSPIVSNIVFQILYLDQEYTFNIRLHDTR